MFKTTLNNFFKRLLVSVLLGLAGGLLLEVVFKLQYRNYNIMQSVQWYIGAIVLTVVFTELVNLLNKRFDRIAGWEKKPVFRLNIQVISYSILALIIFTGLRLTYLFLSSSKQYILLNDEMTIAVLVVFLVILLNIIDFGVVLLNQWRFSLAEAEKYKKESAEFEFEMLQAQINPHFLFNSLNTLSSLVYEDAERSSEFIRKLSDVYRHVLETRHKELVSIGEELTFTESFIFLLEIRFDQKLSVDLQIDDVLMESKIVPLSLQLLIENAVKHNIVSEKKPLHIKVYNDEHYVIVENPLQLKKAREKGSRMGLRNISNRYKAICKKEIVISDENDKFIVKVPII